jgi:hypothetical protein
MMGIGIIAEMPFKQKFTDIGSVMPFDKNAE